MSNNPLVFSTDGGRISPQPSAPVANKGDGIVRIRRETKGRKGKGVTVVTGLPLSKDELKSMCAAMKKRCGTGGAVKQSHIEIQGDHRDTLKAWLEQQGHSVKLAGG